MFSAKLINITNIRHPAFCYTLTMMHYFMQKHPEELKRIQQMFVIATRTCYNIYESDNLVIPMPLKDRETVAFVECDYPKDEARFIQLVDMAKGIVLLNDIRKGVAD